MIQPGISTLPLFPDLEKPPLVLHPEATVVVSLSGGKDSVVTLLEALETFAPAQVMAHHQIIVEDWPGTPDYCQAVCDTLGVPLHMTQAVYHGYVCSQCQNHYLTSYSEPHCRKCSCQEARLLMRVASVLDLVEWREMWPSLDVRFCTSYFKRDNFNRWARTTREVLGAHPVIALGERWRESKGRARLPYVRERSKLEWMFEWRPILDPASCAQANHTVRAGAFYDRHRNGLRDEWPGNVWLNPPYGRTGQQSNQELWTCRLIAQYEAGITRQAILLVNAATDTSWFQRLWAYPICFTDHRIRFSGPNTMGGPTHGSVFVSFGENTHRFISLFRQFGVIARRVSPLKDLTLWSTSSQTHDAEVSA